VISWLLEGFRKVGTVLKVSVLFMSFLCVHGARPANVGKDRYPSDVLEFME
jgi:hypothetical protein